MFITFKNIDDLVRNPKPHRIGQIQPKFWYRDRNDSSMLVLVKRQFQESSSKEKRRRKREAKNHIKETPKNPMYNHFGEYVGYLIAEKAGLKVCPVDLITVNDTRNEHSQTLYFYTGCASHSVIKPGQNIFPGTMICRDFGKNDCDKVKEILSRVSSNVIGSNVIENSWEDNIDVSIAAIISETSCYERNIGKKSIQEIEKDIKENIRDYIEMTVYDCLFGNNDRHSDNWSMLFDDSDGRASLYPLYDNEAVLGFRKNKLEIDSIEAGSEVEYANNNLYSRQGVSPYNSGVNYCSMIEHLVENYLEYAIPAIKKITDNVPESFISEIYDSLRGISKRGEDASKLTEYDELPVSYERLGKAIYSSRREFALNLIKQRKIGNKKEESKSLFEDMIL